MFLGIQLLSFGQIDSTVSMTYSDFITRVIEHHPRMVQAEIVSEMGDAYLLKAKGSFDPKLEGSIQQKYFKGDQYYSLINGGLKIPTWFGITAKMGYDQNQGVYLNPSDRNPTSGLVYAGLEMELGKGLLIDERRAELKKAKLYEQGTELERKMIRLELIFEASKVYWDWMNAHYQTSIYEESVSNAETRLNAIRGTVEFGDRPSIDTVEAVIQLQNRMLGMNQSLLERENAKQKLQLYLWQDGFIPLEIDNAVPVKQDIQTIAEFFKFDLSQKDSFLMNHPYLTLNNLKLTQNEIDLRLKKEQLKPSLTLKYNALNEPIGSNPIANYSPNNYAWGGSVAYPILTRKERGDAKLAELKIEDTKMNIAQISAKIGYNVNVAENKFNFTLEQLVLTQQTVNYYEQLYKAEVNLFEMGESSLFMINSREKAYLDSQLKFIELLAKSMSAGHELQYQLMLD